ncbi:MAG: hypothetical protein ACYC5N_04090, partial [Endomicrobiales bacterium]
YLVWNVILESDALFSHSFTARLAKSLPLEKVDVYVNCSGNVPAMFSCGLFPWKESAAAGRGSGKQTKDLLFYWALTAADDGGKWQEAARGALEERRGRGIVVDIDPLSKRAFVLDAVRYLAGEGEKHGKEVHFRNIALAYAAAGAASRRAVPNGCVIESAVGIGKGLKMRRLFSPGMETKTELLGWQMKIAGNGGHMLPLSTYDRPKQ